VIIGIGIDLVEITRFTHWNTYSDQQLMKVFSSSEITYCRTVPRKSAERFAARFAAKEAAYKAFSPYSKHLPPFFMIFCGWVTIVPSPRGPTYLIDWHAVQNYYEISPSAQIHLSITHTQTTAGAVVVISI